MPSQAAAAISRIAGGYYRPGGRDGSWDIIFGVRYIDVEQKQGPLTLKSDISFSGPIVGFAIGF